MYFLTVIYRISPPRTIHVSRHRFQWVNADFDPIRWLCIGANQGSKYISEPNAFESANANSLVLLGETCDWMIARWCAYTTLSSGEDKPMVVKSRGDSSALYHWHDVDMMWQSVMMLGILVYHALAALISCSSSQPDFRHHHHSTFSSCMLVALTLVFFTIRFPMITILTILHWQRWYPVPLHNQIPVIAITILPLYLAHW